MKTKLKEYSPIWGFRLGRHYGLRVGWAPLGLLLRFGRGSAAYAGVSLLGPRGVEIGLTLDAIRTR